MKRLEEYGEAIVQLTQKIYENKLKKPQNALAYADKLATIGREKDDNVLSGYGYYYMGEAYYYMNDGKHCFRCISEALHCLSIIEDWYMVTCCYVYLGISSANRGNVALALDYNLNGLRYSREFEFHDLTVVIYINMGTISMNYGRYAEAQDYMEEDNKDMMDTVLKLWINLEKKMRKKQRLKKKINCYI